MHWSILRNLYEMIWNVFINTTRGSESTWNFGYEISRTLNFEKSGSRVWYGLKLTAWKCSVPIFCFESGSPERCFLEYNFQKILRQIQPSAVRGHHRPILVSPQARSTHIPSASNPIPHKGTTRIDNPSYTLAYLPTTRTSRVVLSPPVVCTTWLHYIVSTSKHRWQLERIPTFPSLRRHSEHLYYIIRKVPRGLNKHRGGVRLATLRLSHKALLCRPLYRSNFCSDYEYQMHNSSCRGFNNYAAPIYTHRRAVRNKFSRGCKEWGDGEELGFYRSANLYDGKIIFYMRGKLISISITHLDHT